MLPRFPSFALALLAAITPALADEKPIDRMIGQRIVDVRVEDASRGKFFRLSEFRNNARGVVVVFTGIDCPVGNLYMPRLVELAKKYEDRGIVVLGINSNASETPEQVAAHAKEFGLNFPVVKDVTGRAAEAMEAERTCEALLIDGSGRLRYRGAIDDQYGYGVRKEEPTRSDLVDAIEALLADEEIKVKATAVVGCPIEKVERGSAENQATIRSPSEELRAAVDAIDPPVDPSSVGPVTYAEQVAPILQANCQNCHRPGEVGPFKLLSYKDAKRWATSIAEVVDDRRMPPWHADPRHGTFRNDRRLSAKDRATLLAWIEQGAPEGDASKEPAPREWPEGWRIGEPDAVFRLPEPYTVKADGALPYQRFMVDPGFTEDKWARAIECRPSARAVVHHVIVYLVPPGAEGRGDFEHLAAYAPGDLPTLLPEGVAKKIPAGSKFLFELHYTPIGRAMEDQTAVGLIFADEPPKYRAITFPIVNMGFKIPPGAGDAEVKAKHTFGQDAELLGFLPHMHLRGKDFRYTATYPDGRTEVLLSVPQYDFAWQACYWLAEPMPMPKGTRIDCVAHFDNSTANPALTEADTLDEVRWGEQTWEEMMIGYVDVMYPIKPPADGAGAEAGSR